MGCTVLLALGLVIISTWLGMDRIKYAIVRNKAHEDQYHDNTTAKTVSLLGRIRALMGSTKGKQDYNAHSLPTYADHNTTVPRTPHQSNPFASFFQETRRRSGGRERVQSGVHLANDSRGTHRIEAPASPVMSEITEDKRAYDQVGYTSTVNDLQSAILPPPGIAKRPVRYIQLSPCGEWLIVGWKGTSALYRFGVSYSQFRDSFRSTDLLDRENTISSFATSSPHRNLTHRGIRRKPDGPLTASEY